MKKPILKTRFALPRRALSIIALPLLGVLASTQTQAAELTISVTNLTNGINFTPLLIAAHNADMHLFQAGAAASASLTAMAEGGSLDGLTSDLDGISADYMANPASGLLAPGASTTTTLSTNEANTHLSLVGMLLPTNDGFVGLDSWMIKGPGTYTINVSAYDAGTEANNELIVDGSGAPGTAGIPAAPGGDAGTGGTGVTNNETNTMVHIHRGVLGDTDTTGGSSDLDSRIHRWLNPVARITVTVQ
jgi:hypothetical protein